MAIKTATAHNPTQFGGRNRGSAKSNTVSYFWKEGKCNRNPCRFLHRDSPAPVAAPNVYHRTLKQSQLKDQLKKNIKYVLGDDTRGGWLQDESSRKRPNFGDKYVPKNCPSHSAKNSFVLRTGSCGFKSTRNQQSTGGRGFKVVNDQDGCDHGTEDPPGKQPDGPDHNNVLVPTTGESGSKDTITLECSVSTSEVMGPKSRKEQKSCSGDTPEDTVVLTSEDTVPEVKIPEEKQQKVCERWMLGSCVEGEGCQFLHSWFHGDVSVLAKLDGHSKAVSGIMLPSESDKLYSGSKDGTLRVWDCHTGQSVGVMDLGDEIGYLMSEGPWIFVGMRNVVKVWNVQTAAHCSLDGPVGQVYAMAASGDMLLAGLQNGVILMWKGITDNANPFRLAASLEGHYGAVTSLAVGAKVLCSGSMDNTIRVWDLDTMKCIRTLNGHADTVMSLVFWSHQHLLSCSLDGTIKVWFAADGSGFEVTHTHHEGHGAVALCGVNDAERKPVLLCSCNDNSVRLYDLPSFNERGRIFSRQEVSRIQVGPDGQFFTGDGTGSLYVWQWAGGNVAS